MLTILLAVLLLLPGLGVVQQAAGSAASAPQKQGQPDADGVYTPGGDVVPPVLVKQKDPNVPWRVREHASSGMTEVSLIVNVQGMPEGLAVSRSCGNVNLDAAAIKAVGGYRFRPATKNGLPVPVRLFVVLNWQLQG